ncbi:MAG: hypothetical protein HY348_09540 [Nitrospira defluvii]|nr:hypothetical protein [Nitrospira defluvii]
MAAPGRSLKRRIQALGILVALTLVSASFLGFQIFKMTESARMKDAATQLTVALDRMTRQYEDARQLASTTETGPSALIGNSQALRAITQESLTDLPGLEGGFYAQTNGRLLGYAYPTYLGSGPKTDIPEAERPTITRIAGQAIAENTTIQEQLERGFDVILFASVPLNLDSHGVGAAWVMSRLPGIRNPQWRYYGLSLIAMLAMAGLVTGSAWWIARRLDKAIAHVVNGIHTLHGNTILPISATRYMELNRIIEAINHLVKTVHAQQAGREQLERQLHQADRLAILGRLVAGVAHEVRNPLSSIRLKLQLARRGSLEPGKLFAAFDVVEKEVARLDRLVARLLSVAKPPTTSNAPTDINEFVIARLRHWSLRASEFNILLDYTGTEDGRLFGLVDRDRLSQIFDNLIANAVDALTGTGGRIHVVLTGLSIDRLCLVVHDSGPGLSREARPHLFEPFFTTKPQGTGLGLFLSAELARASGGTLDYIDTPEGGACFELRFPYRSDRSDADAPNEPATLEEENACER